MPWINSDPSAVSTFLLVQEAVSWPTCCLAMCLSAPSRLTPIASECSCSDRQTAQFQTLRAYLALGDTTTH